MIRSKAIPGQGRLDEKRLALQVGVLAGIIIAYLPFPVCAETPGEQENRLIYMIRHDCGSCHGYNLDGGLGPPLTMEALKGKSDEALVNTIMYGVKDTPMPPWNSILDKEEVSWIVDQLKSGLPHE